MGGAIELIGTDVSSYSGANWNYVFLVNLIDRFMANTIETYSPNSDKILFDRALDDTKTALLEAKWTSGYVDKIERAFDDIKVYCSQLQLQEYLAEVMHARLDRIKFKSSYKDNVGKAKEYRQQIEDFDKSPEGVTEIDENVWMSMILEFPNIRVSRGINKVLGHWDQTQNLNEYFGKYTKRDEYRYSIEQYGPDKLFNSYRIVFGKPTEVGNRSNYIKEIKKSKYIKLSNASLNASLKLNVNSSLAFNNESEYEGFHPLTVFKEFFGPASDILNFGLNYEREWAKAFGIINDSTKSKPWADCLKKTNYLDFDNIVRLSLKDSRQEVIEDIKKQIKTTKPNVSDVDKELSQYIRYGDIMAIADYILNYMELIDNAVQEQTAHSDFLSKKYEPLQRMHRLTKLLRIARNMLPSEQHMEKMADIISGILQLQHIVAKKNKNGLMTEQDETLLLLMNRLYGKDQYESEKVFKPNFSEKIISTRIVRRLNEILTNLRTYIYLPSSIEVDELKKKKQLPEDWLYKTAWSLVKKG